MTGVVEARGDGPRMCIEPLRCTNVRLTGPLFDQWVAGAEPDERVRLVGIYDGTTLTVTDPVEPAGPDRWFPTPTFPVPCPAPEGGWPTGSFPLPGFDEYLTAHADQVAGRWQGDGGVLVVGFTGDVDAHRAALADLWPSGRLCVIQQPHALRELLAAQADVTDTLQRSGSTLMGSATDEIGDVVRVSVWQTDQATLDVVAARHGDAVDVMPFMVALDGPVGALPPAPPPGPDEIPLVTAAFPADGGMAALGGFTLAHDGALDCIYLEQVDGARVLPIWPYGTTADRATLQIRDPDGRAVATVGDQLSGGGGFGTTGSADRPDACGATDTWVWTGFPRLGLPS